MVHHRCRALAAVTLTLAASLAAAPAASATFLPPAPLTVGVVSAGALDASPDTLELSAAVGDAATDTVTLRNTGTSAIAISQVQAIGSSAFFVGGWPPELSPGEEGTIDVTFAPSNNGGDTADLAITSSEGDLTVALRGDGYYPPFLETYSDNVDFGDIAVGRSETSIVSIGNSGERPLTVHAPTFSSGTFSATSFASGTVEIAPGSSYFFEIQATPASHATIDGTMTITSDGGTSTLNLTVRGVAPVLRATPATGAFPVTEIFEQSSIEVAVANEGDGTADVASVSIVDGGSAPAASNFSVGTTASQILPGDGGQPFSFVFRPDGTGLRTAVAHIRGNDGQTLLEIPLSGSGGAAQVEVASRLDFGTVNVGTTVQRVLTVKNTGTTPLRFNGLDSSAPEFAVTGDTSELAPGATRRLRVSFTPSTPGELTGHLRLDTNAGGSFGTSSTFVDVAGIGEANPRYATTTPLDTGTERPTDIATGDFDEDGAVDLALAFLDSGRIALAIGGGDGSFAAPVTLHPGSGVNGPRDIAAADLDADGHLDLAAVGPTGTRIFLGRGDGTFTTSDDLLAGDEIRAGDLDDDGHLDLVATQRTAGTLRIRRGVGDGTFSGQTTLTFPATATALALSDLNRDGDVDPITATGNASSPAAVTISRNNGTGALGVARSFSAATFSAVDVPTSLGVGHFDEDGRPDVTTGGRLMTATAGGGLRAAVPGGAPGQAVVVLDVDGDGLDDQATTSNDDQRVRVSLGDGAGGFAPPVDIATGTTGGTEPADLAAADVDGDRRPDLLAAKGGTHVDILLNGSATPTPSGAGRAVISEVRFGADAYVQIANRSRSAPLRLDGWQLRFSGGRRLTIPAGTRVAPGGVALATSALVGAGATWSLGDIARGIVGVPADATGVALHDPRGARVDAAGLTSSAAALREGAGLASVTFRGQGAYVRRVAAGALVDTQSNGADFTALDTAAQEGDAAALGSPRPDEPFAPTNRNDILQSSLFAPAAAQSAAPNRERVGDTLSIRRTLTNCSGGLTSGACANADAAAPAVIVTKLRFRVTDLSTTGTSTAALLKVVATPAQTVAGRPLLALGLDAPAPVTGGGLNTTLSPAAGLPPGGLAPGDSVDVAFTLKVVRGGAFRFAYATEDDLVPAPKPTASPGARAEVPASPPVPETVRGSVAAPPATAAAPAALTAATTKKAKARCVTRKQRRKLKGKARKQAKLCTTKTTAAKRTGTR